MTGSSKILLREYFPKSIETPFIASMRGALAGVDSDAEPAMTELWGEPREIAAASLFESSIPTGRCEEWRYFNLVSLHELKCVAVEAEPVLVRQSPHVSICRFSEAVAGRGEAWGRELLARHEIDQPFAQGDASTFVRLNRALTSDPWVIWVEAGTKVTETLELTWKGVGAGQLGYGVLLIDISAQCQVDVVERYGAGGDVLIIETSVQVGNGATCEYLRLQEGGEKAVVLTTASAKLASGAHCGLIQVSTGGGVAREDLRVDLKGEGAEAHLDGLYVARGRQTLDHHTAVCHRVGSTMSRQVYKGILTDESRGVFNGRIEIMRNASGSNSSQLNKNLMLSRKAEIDTKPELRIDNDDVKAAHGATIGRLDPEHVFYLCSRGLNKGAAVELLSRGFALDIIERMKSLELRKRAQEFLSTKLVGLNWEMV